MSTARTSATTVNTANNSPSANKTGGKKKSPAKTTTAFNEAQMEQWEHLVKIYKRLTSRTAKFTARSVDEEAEQSEYMRKKSESVSEVLDKLKHGMTQLAQLFNLNISDAPRGPGGFNAFFCHWYCDKDSKDYPKHKKEMDDYKEELKKSGKKFNAMIYCKERMETMSKKNIAALKKKWEAAKEAHKVDMEAWLAEHPEATVAKKSSVTAKKETVGPQKEKSPYVNFGRLYREHLRKEAEDENLKIERSLVDSAWRLHNKKSKKGDVEFDNDQVEDIARIAKEAVKLSADQKKKYEAEMKALVEAAKSASSGSEAGSDEE